MNSRHISISILSAFSILMMPQLLNAAAPRGLKSRLDFVTPSDTYKAKLDRKSKTILLEGPGEHLWTKLPTALDGDYYGYVLTSNPYASDEWDFYLIKLVMPSLEKNEDLQRITVSIFRSHFPSLKVGGRQELFFEPERDQFVVFGKVKAKQRLRIDGIWLRGFLGIGQPFSLEAKKLD